MTNPVTLEDELKAAFTTQEEPAETNEQAEVQEEVTESKPERVRDETGKFKASEKVEEVKAPVVEAPQEQVVDAPVSLSGAIKAKWKDLPADVQAEWSKRENDIHQMMTRHDGELRMGREMKEVITPYMAIIQAEGGTPSTAVRDLLNTAYQLRTAPPMQKAGLVKQIIETYGVDMNLLGNQQHVEQNSEVAMLRQQIARLEQFANPENLQRQFQEQSEQNRIQAEVSAFANDPAHKHYHAVKAEMAALLGSGRARDINEAYDMACWAKADIRSTLLAEQKTAEEDAKRKSIEAKKKASLSISGSPASPTAQNSTSPRQSLEDELREQVRASRSQAI